jgi:hypothetical protein
MSRTKVTSESVGTILSTQTAYDLDYAFVDKGTVDCTIGASVGYEMPNLYSGFPHFTYSKIGTNFDFSISIGTGTAGVDQIVITSTDAANLAGKIMLASYLRFDSNPYAG